MNRGAVESFPVKCMPGNTGFLLVLLEHTSGAGLFSYKVYRDMPIQGYVTDEELDRILAVIDTER